MGAVVTITSYARTVAHFFEWVRTRGRLSEPSPMGDVMLEEAQPGTALAALQRDSCLMRSALDEPVFVLCGRDAFAPELVEIWVALRTQQLKADRANARTPEEMERCDRARASIHEAANIAMRMEQWQARQREAGR